MSDFCGEKSFVHHSGYSGRSWQPSWLQVAEIAPTLTPILTTVSPTPAIQNTPPRPQLKTRWDLDADQTERFEERCCIMHYDGGLLWIDAERLALEDVLGTTLDEYVRQLQRKQENANA